MNGTSNTGFWIVGGLVLVVVIVAVVWWQRGDRETIVAETPKEEVATTTAKTPAPVAREDRTSSDVATVVAGIPEASSFAALFVSSGTAASVSKTGTYTVFVPTNGAFNLLTPGTMNNMSSAQKKRLVEYHLVSGRAVDIAAVDTGGITAVSKDMLNFEVRDSDNSAMVNSAFIIKQYKAKNGIVYLISNVLVPPDAPLN